MIKETAKERETVTKEVGKIVQKADDGTYPSVLQAGIAFGLSSSNWEKLLGWGNMKEIIKKNRVVQKGVG